jgi:UDP-N-acetylmuramoyl-tripeptide--D-alanyl-D-alanine ligase
MALVVGRWLGVDATQLRHGLAAATGMPGRMERLVFDAVASAAGRAGASRPGHAGGRGRSIVVWHDAYNANPDSMAAALDHVERVGGERWVLVLGDMLELGEASSAEHAAVRRRVAAMQRQGLVKRVAWVGEAMGGPADGAAMRAIAEAVEPGEVVLLKGSRAMRLERVVAGLVERWGEPGSSVDGPGKACGVTLAG